MSSLRKVALAAAFTITMGGMGLSPAKAATETWNFNSPTGQLSNTQNYTSTADGLIATAAGFASGSLTFGTPTALFGKSGSENGLGICGPTCALSGNTDDEITAGVSFIRVQLPTGSTDVHATLDSVTLGEHFEIFGSTSATSGYVPVFVNGDASLQGQSLALGACPGCTFFAFTAVGVQSSTDPGAANILLGQMTANVSAIPIPGALPLFATGLAGLGLLGWRRKKTAA
jgi:hypothetical protein